MPSTPDLPRRTHRQGLRYKEIGRRLPQGRSLLKAAVAAVAMGMGLAPCLQGAPPRVELVYRGLEPRSNGAVYAAGGVTLTDIAYDESSACYYLPTGGFDHEEGRVGSILRFDANGTIETFIEFTGQYGPIKGRLPRGGVVRGADGKFYGVTRAGGDADQGTVFRFASSGDFETVAQFAGTGAAHPTGTLTWGPDGALYGVSTSGGAHGAGTVFKVSTTGALTHLAPLEESTGRHPVDGLTLGNDGAFYGMTDEGGRFGLGTIYKVTPAGQLSAVIHFSGNGPLNKGRRAYGRLLNHTDGFLYGVTQRGGAQDLGTVFKLGLNGTLTTLFANFDNTAALPASSLIAGQDGKLYGATGRSPLYAGAPARVFSITTTGLLTPLAPILSDTYSNGSYSVELRTSLFPRPDGSFLAADEWSILKINSDGFLANEYHFLADPTLTTLVVGKDGSLGGSYDDLSNAIQFSLSSDGRVVNRARFPSTSTYRGIQGNVELTVDSEGRTHGAIPQPDTRGDLFFTLSPGATTPVLRRVGGVLATTQLLAGADGSLYALASGGLYRVPPDGPARVLVAIDYYSPTGERNPDGITFGPDGAIYGVTRAGGAFGWGRLYRCTTDGVVTTLYHFRDGSNRQEPSGMYGGVAFGDDGAMYGVAESGGGGIDGAVYRYKDGSMKVAALPGWSYPLARGADGRVYGIRPVADPLNWHWDLGSPDFGMGSGDFEILRFEPDLSFTTLRLPRGALASPGSLIRGFTPSPDGTLYFFFVPPWSLEADGYHTIYRLNFGQPIPTLLPISELTANGVLLYGTVDPRGSSDTQSYFEFGVSEDDLKRVPVFAGEGQVVTSGIHGLHPDTTYVYRLRSTNAGGSGTTSFATFRTPPGNKPPGFDPFLVRTTLDTSAAIPMASILAAANDPDGGFPKVTFVRPASDRGGTASLVEGVGLTYQPAAGFRGIDVVSMDITDSQGALVTVLLPVEVVGSVDSEPRSDHLEVLADGPLLLVLQGVAAKTHLLQQSTDLLLWQDAASVTADAEGTVVVIQDKPPKTTTFFRLALPPG